MVNELARRVKLAAQGILENESLTADLDDAAASVLLDWGIACAKRVAQSTAGLSHSEARQVMSPRLRATRRLMRLVNRWVANRLEIDAQESAALLADIIEQAAIIYQDFTPPDSDQRDAFLGVHFECADNPPQLIAHLRELLESSGDTRVAKSGEGEGDDPENKKVCD